MGVALVHEDFNEQLESLNGDYICINDLDPIADMELINRLTVTTYEGSTFSLTPSCSCGMTTRETHPDKNIGDKCDYCFTEIAVPSSRKLSSTVWLRAPDGVPAMINPRFLGTMLVVFETRNHQKDTIIHWLLDPYFKGLQGDPGIQYIEENTSIKRGLKYFIEHADEIMELICTDDNVFPKKQAERAQLLEVYRRDKHVLFPTHLPLTDKSFNVIERSHLGNYIDVQAFNPYMEMINTIIGLKRLKNKPSLSKCEHAAAKTLFGLVDYYNNYISVFHNKKAGEYRKQIYGSRLPWTSRQVIVSLTDPHDYDEIHFPWAGMIPLYEYHLTNLMFKDGFTPNQIKARLHRAISNYDEYIDSLFDRLISESPYRTKLSGKPGLPAIHNRNPSLKMASLQQVYITKVKKDPKDITKAISPLPLPGMNGDHDGDETNILGINDAVQFSSLEHLNQAGTVLSISVPNELSGDVNLPKEIWTMIGMWMDEERLYTANQ